MIPANRRKNHPRRSIIRPVILFQLARCWLMSLEGTTLAEYRPVPAMAGALVRRALAPPPPHQHGTSIWPCGIPDGTSQNAIHVAAAPDRPATSERVAVFNANPYPLV